LKLKHVYCWSGSKSDTGEDKPLCSTIFASYKQFPRELSMMKGRINIGF
jgi:hypothetical protein